MKTNVSEISLDAYTDLIESGELTRQQAKVVDFLRRTTNVSREFIAERIRIKETSVCGRIRELIDSGFVEEVGKTKNKSGTTAKTLSLTPYFQQKLSQA